MNSEESVPLKTSDKIKNIKSSDESECLAEDLMLEVIMKLPIKKICQLTCLSTRWRSLIFSPDFLQSYRTRLSKNPKSLVVTLFKEHDSLENINVYHSILKPHEDIDQTPGGFVNSLNVNKAVRITETVNGLVCVCYTNSNKNLMSLALMSIQTGEVVMRLPHTTNHPFGRYFLGFEPVNRVYKLLKVGKPPRLFNSQTTDSNCYDFEILTLSCRSSDMRWDTHPKSNHPAVFGRGSECNGLKKYLDTESFNLNGFLFWLYRVDNKKLLISFDLRKYEFRAIQPPSNFGDIFKSSWLMQFRGQLGLFNGEEGGLLPVIYTFDDKAEEGTCWTRHVIILPCEVVQRLQLREKKKHCRAVPVGNLPTGELLLALVGTCDPFTTIYSYDYTNDGSFKRFVARKILEKCADKRDVQDKRDDYPLNKYNALPRIPYIRFSVDDGLALLQLNAKPL